MKAIVAFLALLIAVAGGQQKPVFEKIVRYNETVAGNKIEVTLHQGTLDFSSFEITWKEGEGLMMDGHRLTGQDCTEKESIGGWPNLETITAIDLKWNDKKIAVPKSLHRNLLNLSLRADSIQFVPRPSGAELLIQATGGDGGGSSLASLVLRKNGKHRQYGAGYNEGGLPSFPYLIDEWVNETTNTLEGEPHPWLTLQEGGQKDHELPKKPKIETIVRYRETVAGTEIEAVLHEREFDFSASKIATDEEGHTTVEGRLSTRSNPKGMEGWPHSKTLAEIELKFGGKKVAVPKSLHLNLMDLDLDPSFVQFISRPSGKELLIQAQGGNGCESYGKSLVLRQNGKHRQYECSIEDDDRHGLPLPPYRIVESVGRTESSEMVKYYSWLPSRKGEGGEKDANAHDDPLLPSSD